MLKSNTAEKLHIVLEWSACLLALCALTMRCRRSRHQLTRPSFPQATFSTVSSSSDHCETLLQHMSSGVATIPQGWTRIDVINDAFCRMFGYTSEELRGQSPTILLPSQAHATLTQRSQTEEYFTMELSLRRKSGAAFPALVNVSKVKDVQGALVCHLVNIQDITALKAQELALVEHAKTQEALLREVNHRVKNNFCSIVGLLQMKREYAHTPQEASHLKDMEAKLSGLATVHRLLSNNGWRPIRLDDLCKLLIQTTLTLAGRSCSVNIVSRTPDVTVSNSQAHHLTMIINELTSNALKYALRPDIPLEITVTLTHDTSGISMTFADNGAGYPPSLLTHPQNSHGTGLRIIQDLSAALRGSLVLHNDHGTVACITFPAQTKEGDE